MKMDFFSRPKPSVVSSFNNGEVQEEGNQANSFWETLTKLPLYTIVFLTPLFFLPWGVYFVSFNKQFLVVLLALVSLFGYLGKSLSEGRISYRGGSNSFLIFFSIAAVVSLIFSESVNTSLLGVNGGETDSFINLLSFVVIFFIASATFTERSTKTVISLMMGSSLVLLFIHILQLFKINVFGGYINFGVNTVGTTVSLAVFLGAQFVLALGALIMQDKLTKFERIPLIIFASLAFVYLFLLNFPIIWFLLALSVIFILVFKFSYEGVEGRNIQSKKAGFLIIFLSLVVFLYFAPVPSPLRKFNVTIPIEISLPVVETLKIVKGAWFSHIASLDGVKDFLFGVGGGNFGYEYLKWRSVDFNYNSLIDLYNARFNGGFSLVLTNLVNLGIVGGVLFVLFLLQQFISAAKNIIQEKKNFIFPILAFFFYSLVTMFMYNTGYVLFLFSFIALGVMKATTGEQKKISLFITPQRTFILSMVLVIGMMISLLGVYYNTTRMISSLYYSSGINTFRSGKIEKGTQKMVDAVNWDGRSEFYYRILSEAFLAKTSSAEAAQNDLQNSIQFADKAIKLNPIDSLNYISLARIYETVLGVLINLPKKTEEQIASASNAHKSALVIYQEAMKYDSKNPEIPLMIARLNFTADKSEEAQIYIKKSLELKQNYTAAYLLLAQILERDGKIKEAIAENKKATLIDPRSVAVRIQLGVLYFRDGQFNAAKKEFELITAELPGQSNNSDALYFLAITHNKLGDKTKALEILDKVSTLNPNNKDLEQLIKNIKSGDSNNESEAKSSESSDKSKDNKKR
jgi:tetratricopeptide (TPR) repeat protein